MRLLETRPDRVSAGALLIRIMVGAVFLTEGLQKFMHPATLSTYGFWSMAHEMRTEWAMLLGSLFLILVGGGAWSLDARLRAARTGAPRAGMPSTAGGARTDEGGHPRSS